MSEGDDWKLNLRLHGEALGRTNDAEALLVDWDNRVARVKRKIGDRRCPSSSPRSAACASSASSPARSRIGSRGPGIRQGGGGEVVLHVAGGRSGPAAECSRLAPRRQTSSAPLGEFSPALLENPPLADEAWGNHVHADSRRPVPPRSAAFGSFADAATSVFDLLESASPGGSLVLGQVDWDEGKCRVIDARGDGVPRGTEIPLARGVPSNGPAGGELLDADALAALGPANWVAAPLDAADGSVVGVLLATGPEGEAPTRDVAQLILVGARLLSYEWESISARAELRRLAELARDRASTDPVTGLPNRETLVRSIEREHELSKRGTVESYVVVCQLRDREALIARFGEAMANLLLKDVAEVLSGAIRRTDYLARVSTDGLSAVLVGCKGPDGALAFLGRFERSLERVSSGRPAAVQLSYGIQRLAEADSPQQALELAEISARSAPCPAERNPARHGSRQGGGVSTDPLMGGDRRARERPAAVGPGSDLADAERRREALPVATSSWSSASSTGTRPSEPSRRPAIPARRRRRCFWRAGRSRRTSWLARWPSATGSTTSTWRVPRGRVRRRAAAEDRGQALPRCARRLRRRRRARARGGGPRRLARASATSP